MDTKLGGFFLLIDIVKETLLRRMVRESLLILDDNFLEPERRAGAITLYERIGDNFVTYIAGLHKIKNPPLLLVLARNAIEVFQDNLNRAWVYAYDGHCELINWLPIPDRVEEIIDEF